MPSFPIPFDPTNPVHRLLRRAYPRNRFSLSFYPCHFVGVPDGA